MQKSKRKRRTWRTVFTFLGIIILCTVLATWITGYSYIYKTLVYTYPDIDDLEIFPSRKINNGIPQPWPVSEKYNKIKLPDVLTNELVENESVAFLVVKDDSIIYEQYWDNYTDKSISNSFSVSKSIVGVLTGIAVGERLFSLDDEVGKYLPEFNQGDNSKLKIEHLLTMSSGLNWDESYSSLFSMTTEAYYGKDLERLINRLKVVEEPGKTFSYKSCNTVLLAMVISNTSGMTITEYASKKLWQPIGAEDPALWSLDKPEGIEKSYCCIYATARDFARVGKLYLDSGKWNGHQIIPSDFVLKSVQPTGYIDDAKRQNDYYGYHWWMMNLEGRMVYYARGILGQYIVVIPEEKIIFVRLGKSRGQKVNNHYSDMLVYTQQILNAFGKKSLPNKTMN
jgi:CubicO group peptidase (beta-lactamase class C family)